MSVHVERTEILRCKDLVIVVVKPPTLHNFLDYNKCCSELDESRLMQPINEAEYDSETQACVDRNDANGPTSFYEHYVACPVRKKGLAVGCECPIERCSSSEASDDAAYLCAPPHQEVPLGAVARGILQDPVARRLATGRLPPICAEDDDCDDD
ncbi:hypothetical protein STCU_03921 [Strigomonas culicis]|uniref:Uncharacterized protein n=1 Tax=Strigomonas culicis TaxID=28005 RepID=S9W4E9_9TRYP|nr:hypothetical protein STCU_06950 [Strigomonas culicis]EPY30730.1 hypothetical protein STCU_03921 [Strigomonas culicis]|eukprot:EPY24896.1 hypothetical protein STCU_06950 [Strigomonas culicis]